MNDEDQKRSRGEIKELIQQRAMLKLQQLMRSRYRLDKFREIRAPSIVIEREGKFYEGHKRDLRTMGVKIDAYLRTTQFSIRYIAGLRSVRVPLARRTRCERCLKQFLRNDSVGCLIYEDIPFDCKSFEDSGKSMPERIIEIIARCGKCTNHQLNYIEEIGIDEIKCGKDCNQLNPNCLLFREITDGKAS